MPQVFNLRGENVQTIAELRVDVIKNQDASIDIITVDNGDGSITIHNLKEIFTINGRRIIADDIQET